MTKQLLTLMSILWIGISFCYNGENSVLYKSAEQKDAFQADLINKLQKTKSGNLLTCNLRLKNTSEKIKYVESIEVIVEIEATNLKNNKIEVLKRTFIFSEEWIIGQNDYAFYQPLNQSITNGGEYTLNKINTSKIREINYGIQGSNPVKGRDCSYEKETTLGMAEGVIVKASFQKEADRSPGYYKNGLDLNKVGHQIKVHCTVKLNNSSNKAIKMKKDLIVGIEVGGKSIYKEIKATKLRSKQNKIENLFSIHFSDKLKAELPKAAVTP